MKRYWTDIAKIVGIMLLWRAISWVLSGLLHQYTEEQWFITLISAALATHIIESNGHSDRREGGE